MNIRRSAFAILVFVCVGAAAQAQQVPQKRELSGSGGTPAAGAAASASASTQFPDEQKFVIHEGTGQGKTGSKALRSYGVWDFVQMLLILGLVVVGIYLLFYFLKKAGGPRQQESEVINLLSTRALQSNRSLHLVEVGKQIFLVGSSESGVALVAEIHDRESIDEIRIKAAERGTLVGRRGFRDVFAGMFTRSGPGATIGAPAIDPFGFIRQQRERLKKM